MDGKAAQFTVLPGDGSRTTGEPPGAQYQECWFSLARERWASLVLVPADVGTSVSHVATSLAEIGSRLRDTPVTAIIAESLDFGAARTLSDLEPRLKEERPWSHSIEVAPKAAVAKSESAGHTVLAAAPETRIVAAPMARVVIAIRSVVEEPLGVAVAQSADAVVVCVELGKTRIASTRRTIRVIGAERIIGALLIR